MQTQIDHQPSFAWLKVQLDPGDIIQAEAGAMVTMTPGLPMSTHLGAGKGGMFRSSGVLRCAGAQVYRGGADSGSLFGGEGLFFMECSGNGEALYQQLRQRSSRRVPCNGRYIVDTGTSRFAT